MKEIRDKAKKEKGIPVFLRLLAYLILLGGYGLLASLPDLGYAVPEMVGGTAILTLILAIICYLGTTGKIAGSPAAILILAACFRLLFVFHPAQLSDDIYRYLFDGRQLLSGVNPYALPPDRAVLPDADGISPAGKVNHPELVTIYPPGAQILFAAGTLFGGVVGMKLFWIGLDLLLILLILRLLSALDLPPGRAILYAWHPLPVLEIAASGHIDGAGMLFVFLALCALLPQPTIEKAIDGDPPRAVFSGNRAPLGFIGGLIFSVAVLVKFFPVVFLPGYLRLSRDCGRKAFLPGFLIGCLLLIFPFLPDIRNSFATLRLYTASWEFAGFLFRMLRDLSGSGTVARVTLGVLFAGGIGWCHGRRFFRKTMVSPRSGPLMEVLQSCYAISLCFLLLTPTLHPWYALYLLSFLPFCPGVAGITLSWSVFLGYRVLIANGILHEWREEEVTPLMIWMAPVAAFLLFRLYRFSLISQGQDKKTIDPCLPNHNP